MIYNEYDDKSIQTFEYETTMISDGSVIGTCELGKATIQLLNDSNKYSTFKDSWIKTIHGSFYIYNVEPVQEKINIKLECYDIKYKLDTPYDSKKHSFPCSLKAWRNSIFNSCEVDYDNSNFPNSNLMLENEPYIESGSSNREVIKMIAQAGASSVITDSNDKFYFVWFEDIVHNADDWIELTTEKEHSNPINCVVLGRGNAEDNVYYPESKPTKPIEFRIDNNYILDPQDTTSTNDLRYITSIPIYNQVKDFSYLIFSMRSQSIPNKLSIKLGQQIKYLDIWSNELVAYIMTKKINWLGGDLEKDDNYEITLSADKISETSTDLSYSSSIKNDISRVERKADKTNKKIEDLIEETTYNSHRISQVEQSVDTIEQQISGEYGMDREVFGTNQVFIEDALKYYPLEIKIDGYSNTGNLLYPGTFYPGDDAFPLEYKEPNTSTLTICVDSQNRNNPTENLVEYAITLNEPLRSLGSIKDELEISVASGEVSAQITRYLDYNGSNIVKRSIPLIEPIQCPKIELLEHENYVYIKEKPNYKIYVRYLVYSTMNEFYATRVELNSSIKQTKDSINLEVSKKAGKNEIISTINQSAEGIKILANKLGITANDVLDIIAGNEINLKSKNIKIKSDRMMIDNLGVYTLFDANGNKIAELNGSGIDFFKNGNRTIRMGTETIKDNSVGPGGGQNWDAAVTSIQYGESIWWTAQRDSGSQYYDPVMWYTNGSSKALMIRANTIFNNEEVEFKGNIKGSLQFTDLTNAGVITTSKSMNDNLWISRIITDGEGNLKATSWLGTITIAGRLSDERFKKI